MIGIWPEGIGRRAASEGSAAGVDDEGMEGISVVIGVSEILGRNSRFTNGCR